MKNTDKFTLYQNIFCQPRQQVEMLIEERTGVSPPILALANIVLQRKAAAREILKAIDISSCDGIDRLAYLETELLERYLSRDFLKAKEHGERIIQEFPNAGFANFVLSRIYLIQRDRETALLYLEKLFALYPKCDSLPLDIAQTLFFLKRYDEALSYVMQSHPNTRQRLYRIFLLFGYSKFVMLYIALISVVSVITRSSILTYYCLSALLLSIAFFSLLKLKDSFLWGITLYLEVILTVIWFFIYWVWSLQSG